MIRRETPIRTFAATPLMSKHAVWKLCQILLALIFFAAVAVLLYRHLREVHWDQVWMSIRAYPAVTVLQALAFAASGYLAFASYDLLGKHYLQHRVTALRSFVIALVAYALNLNLGAMVGGWAMRFRLYFRAGLDAGTVAQIIALGVLSNWTGYLLLGGYIFVLHPPTLPADWTLNTDIVPAIGLALWIGLLAYLLLCATRSGRNHRIGRLALRVPSPGLAGMQLVAATMHWMSMALVLHALLPSSLPLSTILGVLLIASIAGAVTHVPGGLGVIEAVFLAALGDRVDTERLIGALFAFRAVFYLIPLLLALMTYPLLELRRRRGTSAAQQRAVRI